MNKKINGLELKFCAFDCIYATPSGRGACNTFNLIECDKYKRQVDKGQSCMYYHPRSNK